MPDLVTQRHVRILTFGGLALAGTLCPIFVPALAAMGTVAVGVGTVITGVAGGVVATDAIAHHLNQIRVKLKNKEALANEHLIKASGLAVGLLIEAVAESGKYPQDKSKLEKLAIAAAEDWTKLIAASRDGNLEELKPLQEEEINTIFAKQGKDFFEQKVLTAPEWETILQRELCYPKAIELQPETMAVLREKLHKEFAKALREVLKQDFEEGGKAFAGLTLSMMGEMLAILRKAPVVGNAPDLRPVLDAIAQLEAQQQQLCQTQGAALGEIASQQELAAQKNEAGFIALGKQIDSGFEAVMTALGLQGEQIRDLRDWLQGKLEDISQQLTEIGQDTGEIKIDVKEILRILKAQQESRVKDFSFVLDTNALTVTSWQGREKDLAIVNEWLTEDNTKLGIIVGIGGLGKSTLAAKVFHERTDFLDKMWIDLGNRPKFLAVAQGILEKLGKATPEQLQQLEQMTNDDLIRGIISVLQQERFLLVWDNLETVLQDEGYQEFLQRWLSKSHNTEILVTTQDLPQLMQPTRMSELALGGLEPEAGAKLLADLKVVGTREELAAFSAKVQGHPLTLHLVAGLLQDEVGDEAKSKKLASLKEDMDQLLLLEGEHRDVKLCLVTVLDASFERLAERFRKVLLALVVVRGNFDGSMAAAISGESVTNRDLLSLGKRGFLTVEESGKYTFQPFILEYLKYKTGDLTPAHRSAIKFYQSRYKPRTEWQTVADVQEYLEVFRHLCQLGEYPAAFDVIRTGDNVDDFLSLRGNNQILVELYQQLKDHLPDHQDWRYSASLTSLGGACYFLGRYQEAIDLQQQSLVINQELGDRLGVGGSLCNLGNAYEGLGEHETAINYYNQALDELKPINCREFIANSLGGLGNAYHSLGRYQEAINFLQQSLVIAQEIGDRRGEANSLGNLGVAYSSLGRYQEAIDFHQQSLVITQEIGDRKGEATSLRNLGATYHSLGCYQEAIDFHQQSLAIKREIGNRHGESASLNNLGAVYKSLGRSNEAIDLYQQSLAIQRGIGNRQGESASLNNLGNAYNSLGRYDEAIDFYQQSLVIAREIGDRQGEATSLNNLGNAYNSLGRYQEAIDFHQQSLVIKREIGDRRGEAASLGSLGNAYNSLGRYQEAISYYEKSLLIKQEIEDKRGAANLLFTLGALYQKVGRIKEGFATNQQATDILQELDLPLDAYPIPNWQKKLVKFAQSSNLKFILCIILGIFAFPFALVGFLLLTLYRLLRSHLPRP